MRQKILIQRDAAGHPKARIPNDGFWSLAEYLSFHRQEVWYRHEDDNFTITFPRMEPAAAQRLLDDWTHGDTAQEILSRDCSWSIESGGQAIGV